ncbi:MAG: hypothetical protein AB8B54_02960 [Sphingorhabdus sp.]
MKLARHRGIAGAIAIAALAVSPAAASDEDNVEVQAKKPKKISDRRHPDYVRCRLEPIIGSLTRKRRVCMTNAEWVDYSRTGSRNAKEFVDDNQPGFMMQ